MIRLSAAQRRPRWQPARARQFEQPAPAANAPREEPATSELPQLKFDTAQGTPLDLHCYASGWLIIFCYPGAPATRRAKSHLEDLREHAAFAGHAAELRRRGVRLASLSSQPLPEQAHLMHALGLDYPMLADPDLALAARLSLDTTTVAGDRYYARQTLLVRERQVEHVFCPIPDAARNPDQIRAWMLTHGW